ncbi:signal peptidase I [Pseudonocardiaceae bacterium YIM PH 21723]|nr:signal peptidase I [Pseudonocardiaceae bacterium YIM PH 21723]
MAAEKRSFLADQAQSSVSDTPEDIEGDGAPAKRDSFWRELPILVVTALVLTFLIQTFLGRVYLIPSSSMEQTLHGCTGCSNDRVLVDKVTFRFRDPRPGDVVVFRGPESWGSEAAGKRSPYLVIRWLQQAGSVIGIAPPDERDFIKRIIAVGGQTVQCCDARNRVIVDGRSLDESPYLYYHPALGPEQRKFAPVKVPDGQLWVMGDNRQNSSDSRVAGHGPIPVDNVIGKARFIVLPVTRWSGINDHNPQALLLLAAWPLTRVGRRSAVDAPVTP